MNARTSLILLLPFLGACSTHRPNVTPAERSALVQSPSPETTSYYLDGERSRARTLC